MKRFITIAISVLLMVGIMVPYVLASTEPDKTEFYPIRGARLAAFGDSITEYGKVWRELVAEQTGATVINCGKGGSNTGSASNHALDRFDWQVAPQYPDFVTIMYGINDAVIRNTTTGNSSVPLENYIENIKTIITKVKNIDAIPILITEHHVVESIWYSRYDEELYAPAGGINAMLDTYYDALRRIAEEEDVHLIDFTEVLDEYEQSEAISSDGVHLTQVGNTALGECVAEYLTENFPGTAPETSTKYTVTSATSATTTSSGGGNTTPDSGEKSYTPVYDFAANPRGVSKTNATASLTSDSAVFAPDATDSGALAIVPSKANGTTTAGATYTFAFGAGSGAASATTKPAVPMSGDGLQVWVNFTSDDYTSLTFNFMLHTYGDSANVTGAQFAAKDITVSCGGQWVTVPYSAFTNSTGTLESSTNGTRANRIAAINRFGITVNVPTVDDINKVAAVYVDSLGYYTNVETTSTTATTPSSSATQTSTTTPTSVTEPSSSTVPSSVTTPSSSTQPTEPSSEAVPTESTTQPTLPTPSTAVPTAPITTTKAPTTAAPTTTEQAPTNAPQVVSPAKPKKVKGVTAKSRAKKKVTVTWKAAKNAKKYVVKYSYKKNMKSAKTTTVKKLKTTLKKLKSGKKVYIQVQGINGKTRGAWSAKKSVRVK